MYTFRSNTQRQSGYTLVELLLYVTLLGGLITVVSVFITETFSARVKSETIAEVEQQGNQVLHVILQIARNAEAISLPAVGASGATTTLDVVAAGDDPTRFDENAGTIRVREGPGVPVALTNTRVTATGLTFSNLSRPATPGILRVQFTLTYNNTSGRNEYDFSKTFYGTASLRQP